MPPHASIPWSNGRVFRKAPLPTLEEARRNLQEAVALVLEANRELIVEATQGQSVIREPLKVSA